MSDQSGVLCDLQKVSERRRQTGRDTVVKKVGISKKSENRRKMQCYKQEQKAPEFTLPDQNGELHSLKDYRGKRVLLYFYPRDNTPGCTKQACGYSERYPQFEEKGVVILGISKDSVASHKRFEEKQGLTITLLSDTELEVIQAYDVWKEKKELRKSIHGSSKNDLSD